MSLMLIKDFLMFESKFTFLESRLANHGGEVIFNHILSIPNARFPSKWLDLINTFQEADLRSTSFHFRQQTMLFVLACFALHV